MASLKSVQFGLQLSLCLAQKRYDKSLTRDTSQSSIGPNVATATVRFSHHTSRAVSSLARSVKFRGSKGSEASDGGGGGGGDGAGGEGGGGEGDGGDGGGGGGEGHGSQLQGWLPQEFSSDSHELWVVLAAHLAPPSAYSMHPLPDLTQLPLFLTPQWHAQEHAACRCRLGLLTFWVSKSKMDAGLESGWSHCTVALNKPTHAIY